MVCVGGRVTYFNVKSKGLGLEIRMLFSCIVSHSRCQDEEIEVKDLRVLFLL